MRRAAKRDKNEREIIEALEAIGCFVMQETNIDLYVLTPQGNWTPIEIKTKSGKLTPYQVELHNKIKLEQSYEIPIVKSIDEAITLIQSLDNLT